MTIGRYKYRFSKESDESRGIILESSSIISNPAETSPNFSELLEDISKITFNRTWIDGEWLEQLCKAIAESKVKSLKFEFAHATDIKSLQVLLDAGKEAGIKSIDFLGEYLWLNSNLETMLATFDILSSMGLEELHLSGCRQISQMPCIEKINALITQPQFRSLSLTIGFFGEKPDKDLWFAFCKTIPFSPMKELLFSCNNLHELTEEMWQALHQAFENSNIKSLKFVEYHQNTSKLQSSVKANFGNDERVKLKLSSPSGYAAIIKHSSVWQPPTTQEPTPELHLPEKEQMKMKSV